MDKATVEKAMNPLDVAFNQISMRKEDKEHLAEAVEQVKTEVRHAIIADVTSSLADTLPALPIDPAAMLVQNKDPQVIKTRGVQRALAKALEDNVKAKRTGKKPVTNGKKLPVKKGKPVAAKKVGSSKATVASGEKQAPVDKPELRGNSTVEKPTKLVWSIADEVMKKNPKAKRADILAECDRRGVTYYTARTQYQLWKASRGSK